MKYLPKEKYLSEIKKYQQKIDKETKHLHKKFQEFFNIWSISFEGDAKLSYTNLASDNTNRYDFDEKIEMYDNNNFFRNIIKDKLDYFINLYINYYYLSEVEIVLDARNGNIVLIITKKEDTDYYGKNKTYIYINKKDITINGLISYNEETTYYYDTYFKNLEKIALDARKDIVDKLFKI